MFNPEFLKTLSSFVLFPIAFVGEMFDKMRGRDFDYFENGPRPKGEKREYDVS